MSPGRRRLVALAAALVPARAGALLARLGDPGSAEASAMAALLSTAPRRVRLAALAAALAEAAPRGRPAGSVHPLLARLERERAPAEGPPGGPHACSDRR